MIRSLLSVLFMALTTALPFADAATSPAPTKEEMTMKVVFGEKTARFALTEKSGRYFLSFSTNDNGAKERLIPMTPKDASYLLSKFDSIDSASANSPSSCLQHRVRIEAIVRAGKNRQFQSCAEFTNEKLGRVANLLASLAQTVSAP
jgi:hypothetical protein